jgi:pimeloyl-ACP methyl ester carboxylesterase
VSVKTSGNARFTVGVNGDASWNPRVYANARPLIFCHSAGMTGGEMVGYGQLPAVAPLVSDLIDLGFPAVAPTLGVEWGNATSMARITDALAWLRARNGTTAPAVLVGASMGACAAVTWAAANPTDVACIVGLIPAIDLQAIRVADTGGLRSSIDTAYGIAYPAAMAVGTNPVTLSVPGVPIGLWTASNDAVSANAANLAGATVTNVGALGHTTAAVAAAQAGAVAFVRANTR